MTNPVCWTATSLQETPMAGVEGIVASCCRHSACSFEIADVVTPVGRPRESNQLPTIAPLADEQSEEIRDEEECFVYVPPGTARAPIARQYGRYGDRS